jgi:diguanylate cyclase (GGDEF)-like protein
VKILVADDSRTNLALITSSLQKLGHEVTAATTGAEAISLFQQERPDLIILDVVMENMDGFECAKKIRNIDSDNWIPIIFLSESIDDNSIEKGINAGGDDYLIKPFSEITLAAKIKAMQRIAEMRNKLFTTTKELEALSSIDTLTDVYNRFQFERTIKEKITEANRHDFKLAVLFVDIDHFKSVNDTFGHHIGDELLKEITNRLKECLHEEDFIARIGSDEFVVLLSLVNDSKNAGETAQKIICALSPIYELQGNNLRITASIGVACYPQNGKTVEAFIRNADIAMYHAKELGRNNFQYYTEDLNEKYRKQISLEHELKFALERNELYITYQPIYNLLSNKMVGMEALLRWNHPEYGIISPDIFIPIAEETGLILEIGAWVLKSVCEQGAKWFQYGHKNITLSVNLSLHQFLQTDFFESVTKILRETNMPPTQLELELTESTVITYTVHLKKTINKLHDMGIRISVDDFGTRYSSLTSLRYLPISTLKIDKEFVEDILTDPKNSIIVKSLVALGNSLNLNVIAEGVQSEEQLQFLILNGCFHGQGFFLKKPLNQEEMTLHLNEHAIFKAPS